MFIDDRGSYGGGSDHNWIFLDLEDRFVKKKRVINRAVKNTRWDIRDDQDWTDYKAHVGRSVPGVDVSSVDNLASSLSASILHALTDVIGLKSSGKINKPRLLPPSLVNEFRIRDQLEQNWKTLNVANANSGSMLVNEVENMYNAQNAKVSELLLDFRSSNRTTAKLKCSGPSIQARRNFWSHISPSGKQTSDISAVVDPVSGAVKCDVDEIKSETEKHIINVFEGCYEKIPPVCVPHTAVSDHSYNQSRQSFPGSLHDHSYSFDPSPSLPCIDSSGSLETDPGSWLNNEFSAGEVKKIFKKLNNGKAKGWDNIPNEALKNLPDSMIDMLTLLFNMIKSSGKLPNGWNRGRITLIHKRGLRELLGNYRPITVLISLSGLYSKVLNDRLSQVTEEHRLLGEIQNGFRKNCCGADNSFVLDTI